MTRKFVPDDRLERAPALPTNRPATRHEIWERNWFLYHDLKDRDEIAQMSKRAWVMNYVWHFNFRGWRKHPDWAEGQPVALEAVPTVTVFWLGDVYENERILYACLERVRERRAA